MNFKRLMHVYIYNNIYNIYISADMYIFLYKLCLLLLYCCSLFIFYLYLFSYFSKLLKLRFLTQSTLHSLILLNSEAKIFNTLFYSLFFLSC